MGDISGARALGERISLGSLAAARLPPPRCPAPGPLDVAVALLVNRAAPFRPEVQTALYARLGWPSGQQVTRRAAGADIGLSSQRLANFETRLRTLLVHSGAPPALLQALAVLTDTGPCRSDEAALLVVASGAGRQIVHPAAVLELARMARVPLTVGVTRLSGGQEVVGPPERLRSVATVVKHASVVVRRCKAVRIDGVLSGCAERLTDLETDLALGCLPRIGRDGEVLYLREDHQGQLAEPVARMLAVAGALQVASLLDGLRRTQPCGQGVHLVDEAMLAAYLRGQPHYRVETDGLVRPHPALSRGATTRVLSRADRIILAAGDQAGEVPRTRLMAALGGGGYSRGSCAALIARSPLLVPTARGRYRLRTSPPRDLVMDGG